MQEPWNLVRFCACYSRSTKFAYSLLRASSIAITGLAWPPPHPANRAFSAKTYWLPITISPPIDDKNVVRPRSLPLVGPIKLFVGSKPGTRLPYLALEEISFMRYNNKKYLFGVLINMGILIAACGDPGRDQAVTGFTEKKWQLTKLTVTPALDWDLDGRTEEDIFPLLDTCEKNQQVYFGSDRSMVKSYPNEYCNEELAEPQKGSWNYNEEGNIVIVNDPGESIIYKLSYAAPGALKLRYNFEDTQGKPHEITATYETTP